MMMRLLVAVAAVSAVALAGCSSGSECPEPTATEEYCFAWPLPEDAGTGGEPGACPDPASQEAETDVATHGKSASGDTVQEGVQVLGAGSAKQGQCCYRAKQIYYCE